MTAPNFTDKTIWTGDNLDILRGMNSETVDLIYLDPPFNSNQNYAAPVGSKAAGAAFKDTWHLSDLDLAWMGLIADEQPATANLLKTAGLAHGKGMQSYLTMMAVRLLEMHRALKPTGSLYLHCDPTASHYLKLLMDTVFDAKNFVNEIVWCYELGGRVSKRTYGRRHDVLLFYSKSSNYTFNWDAVLLDWDEKGKAKFRYEDERGRYRLIGRFLQGSPIKGHRDISPEWEESHPELVQRYYMKEGKAQVDFWNISPINQVAKERVGYPTQKPLSLLERIIRASSNESDIILDPFCGCATTCVAADKLSRKWVGIDISPKAVELVNMRLQETMGSLFYHGYVTARTDIPQRTDIDAPKNYRQNKHVLFGQQEGLCNGCRVMFPFRNFTVDHMVPQSRGGTDHLDNLQLLCGACNSVKGDRPQEHLIARLKEMVI